MDWGLVLGRELHGLWVGDCWETPYLGFREAVPFGGQVEHDAVRSSWQSNPADEENSEDKVRECSSKVDDLQIKNIHSLLNMTYL